MTGAPADGAGSASGSTSGSDSTSGGGVAGGSATESRSARFSVRVPDSWYEFDVRRATRTGDLARLVDERVARLPALAEHRAAVLRLLREVATDAERRGAVCCAAMAEPDGAGGTLLATVMGFVTLGAADPAENTVEAIAAQLTGAAAGAAAGDGPPESAADVAPVRRVSLVELDAGRAVRSEGVERIRLADRGADCVVMQTVLPVPDDPALVNVVLVSPNVELAGPFLDLFAAISATVSWLDPEP